MGKSQNQLVNSDHKNNIKAEFEVWLGKEVENLEPLAISPLGKK